MKKGLFIAALAMISLASCKKDRVCECTTSSSAGGPSVTQKFTLVDVSKGVAKKKCVSSKEEDSSSGTTVTETTTCTLK